MRRPRGEGRGPRGVRRAEGVPIPPPGAGGPLEEVGGHEEQEEPAGPFDKSVAIREPGMTRRAFVPDPRERGRESSRGLAPN